MEMKFLEIRDKGTYIPALAISISGDNGSITRRAGYGLGRYILLIKLMNEECYSDPFKWSDRTMHNAHIYLQENWENVKMKMS